MLIEYLQGTNIQEDEDEDDEDEDEDSLSDKGNTSNVESLPATLTTFTEPGSNIENEKKRDLNILESLLGGNDTLAWEPDSDLEELAKEHSDKKDTERNPKPVSNLHPSVFESIVKAPEPSGSKAALKDMFAPRPEDGN